MRKVTASLKLGLMLSLLTAAIGQAQTLEQKKGEVFALGVNFGIASFFASVVVGSQSEGNEAQSRSIRYAIADVGIGASGINRATDAPAKLLDDGALDGLRHDYYDWAVKNVGSPVDLYAQLIALRDGFTAKFAKLSAPLTHAYVLGVNLGIASGQATREDARQVVYASLVNAKAAAQALNLDVGPLDVCIALASGSTPMEEIYIKIVSIRSTFQSSF